MGLLGNAKPVVIICTRERAVSMPFYRDILGLPLMSEDPFAAVFRLNGAIMRLSTVEGWKAHAHTVFGFAVADIAQSAADLSKKGVAIIRYPGVDQDADGIWTAPDKSARVAWFSDPDGNNLSLTGPAN